MSETAKFWRLTLLVTIKKIDRVVEFRHHSVAVPGTKKQAVRHLRRVCEKMWPTAKLRLVAATPDRQAEAREARISVH